MWKSAPEDYSFIKNKNEKNVKDVGSVCCFHSGVIVDSGFSDMLLHHRSVVPGVVEEHTAFVVKGPVDQEEFLVSSWSTRYAWDEGSAFRPVVMNSLPRTLHVFWSLVGVTVIVFSCP
jgi:hypothetical protein